MTALADAWDDLDGWLGGDDNPALDVDEALVLDGQVSADRALRRLARLAREERDVRQVADAERDRITGWEADRLTGIGSRRRWLTDGLEGFMRAMNATTGGKTLSLPWGTLRLRGGKPRVEVVDPAQTKGLPAGFLRAKDPEVDKAAIQGAAKPGPVVDRLAEPGYRCHSAVTADGVVLPGVCFLVPVADGFKATPSDVDD